ncbi:MAG: glycosyltransferase family 2 protein [bacterium]
MDNIDPAQRLKIVIPVLGDDAPLVALLSWLSDHQLRAIVVDGAASNMTRQLVCDPHVYLSHTPGRGAQIARGIEAADADWVWVLHADGIPSRAAVQQLFQLIKADRPCWGRFNVEIDGLSLVAYMMNVRSRLSKICTGDQGMFFHARLLAKIGGYPAQPLMEDIEVSKRLKAAVPDAFVAASAKVETSPRRWQHSGVMRTILVMWLFRWRYFRGADPAVLARAYYHGG